MSRTAVFVAAIAMALPGIGTARGAGALPAGFSEAESSAVHPGVGYQRIVKPARPLVAHVARIEPGAAVDLRVVSGHDKVPNRFADLETTGSMCRRVQCLVGVNGDFHHQEEPVGGVVIAGRMLRSPEPGRPQLTIDPAGRLSAGALPWSGSLILGNGTRVALAGVNVPPRDGIVLYTPDWGPQTTAPGRIEVLLGTPSPPGLLNQPIPAELRTRRAGPGDIPPGGAVLSAGGAGAVALEKAWADVQRKAVAPQAQLHIETPLDVAESLGVNPVVLRGGRRALPWPEDPNVITGVHPRTLVGWNPAGERFIVAVDGRQPASVGLTMAEAADFLLGLGATDAVNLDGGGGTTFVVGGALRNRPSDRLEVYPPQERVAPNALVVVARPVATPPPLRPLTVGEPGPGGDGSRADGSGALPTPPDGPTAQWTWGDPTTGVVTAPDGGGSPPGQPPAETGGGVHVAALIDGVRTGHLTDAGRSAPVTAGPEAGRPADPTRSPPTDGPAPGETARALPAVAAGAFHPAGRPPTLLEHPATRAAAGLLLLPFAVLAAATIRRRRTRRQPSGSSRVGERGVAPGTTR